MSTVEVHPEPIEGPWIEGFVLDRHVVSSYPIGHVGEHMQFETTRSALRELLYQLKYKSGPATDIVETAVAFIQERWTGMVDVVIAPPPSLHRASQPTSAILDGLAIGLGVVALSAALAKSTATPQMKNVTLAERGPLLQAAIQAGTQTHDEAIGRSAPCRWSFWRSARSHRRAPGSMSSTKVFVAGSRAISRLPAEIRSRIDTMVDKEFTILVGDANGADKAFQKYLVERAYPNVLVYFMKGRCRNNLGSWPTQEVSAPRGARGFDFYAVKDLVMAEAADYGLMLWDGESRGTLNNVVNLAQRSKPVVVYVGPTRTIQTVRSLEDVRSLSADKSVDEFGLSSKLPFGAAR